jgi:hypothetical protein
MIAALLLGRKGSVAFPGKNTYPVLGRKMAQYPMLAAQNSRHVDKVYLSTDCEDLMALAKETGVEVIERPPELCTAEALGEDAYVHGYEEIKRRNPGENLEYVVLLFCNAATLLASQIDEGVEILKSKPEVDSAVTAGRMNWYSPVRARRVNDQGCLDPFIPFEAYAKAMEVSCDRDAQGDVYFADVCVSVVRPQNLDDIDSGLLPQKWMGQKIARIDNIGGLDIDEEWQLPLVEGYLLRNGFTETRLPYE